MAWGFLPSETRLFIFSPLYPSLFRYLGMLRSCTWHAGIFCWAANMVAITMCWFWWYSAFCFSRCFHSCTWPFLQPYEKQAMQIKKHHPDDQEKIKVQLSVSRQSPKLELISLQSWFSVLILSWFWVDFTRKQLAERLLNTQTSDMRQAEDGTHLYLAIKTWCSLILQQHGGFHGLKTLFHFWKPYRGDRS